MEKTYEQYEKQAKKILEKRYEGNWVPANYDGSIRYSREEIGTTITHLIMLDLIKKLNSVDIEKPVYDALATAFQFDENGFLHIAH